MRIDRLFPLYYAATAVRVMVPNDAIFAENAASLTTPGQAA
jgi:hypothetical protein